MCVCVCVCVSILVWVVMYSQSHVSISATVSDNELDLVDTQQLELDDVLTQLETNLSQYTPVLAEAQHADLERTRT